MTDDNPIRFFHNGEEYVTRAQIIKYYRVPKSNFDRLLSKLSLSRVVDCAKFYYKRADLETVLDARYGRA